MRLAIRVDTNPSVGFGHLSRCQALAEYAINAGWEVAFFCRAPFSAPDFLKVFGQFHVESKEETLFSLICAYRPNWLLVDGYHFANQVDVISSGIDAYIAYIDDLALPVKGNIDLLISPAGQKDRECLSTLHSQAQLLVGYQYTMLKTVFSSAPSEYSGRNNLLVSFGGSDIAGLTLPVTKALIALGVSNINVVITSTMDIDPAQLVDLPIRLHQDLPPDRMAQLMSGVRTAIVAAGSTLFELAVNGVPSVACVVADNQINAAYDLKLNAGFEVVDCIEEPDTDTIISAWQKLCRADLVSLHHRASRFIDGDGCLRILEQMRERSGF